MRLGPTARATLGSALTVLLLGTSACGGDGDAKNAASPAVQDESPSASPSPTAAPPPVPTSPTNTTAGRIAFATYFVKAYNYAYATNDATPITSVGSTGKGTECQMCTELKTYLDGQKAKGLHLEPANLPVKQAFETAHIRDNVWVVDIQSAATKRADVDESGHPVKTYPAKKNYLIEVGVAWENGHYRVTGWKSGENT